MKSTLLRKVSFLLALIALSCVLAAPCQTSVLSSCNNPETTGLSDHEVMIYFIQVVFDIEYGGENYATTLRRWEQPIRIRVYGSPTDEDLATLDQHIQNLNKVEGMPIVLRVTTDENIQIYFVPLDDIKNHIDGYVKGNWGFFRCCWGSNSAKMIRAQIGIATDVTDQQERNHLILEEFTQTLGIMQDSKAYSDSIFYSEWTETQQLSALDWTIVRMVYSSKIEAGMSATKVQKILEK
jgi:hypothetical protein